jgi:hypothetical protein
VAAVNGEIPERARGLDNDLVDIVRQTLDELTNNVLALEQAASRGISRDQVADRRARPRPVCVLGRAELKSVVGTRGRLTLAITGSIWRSFSASATRPAPRCASGTRMGLCRLAVFFLVCDLPIVRVMLLKERIERRNQKLKTWMESGGCP